MLGMERFFKNPFTKSRVGIGPLLAFTTDHVERLKADNSGGQWTARLAATTAALAAVNGSFVADQSKLGQRKGSKQTKRMFRRGLAVRLAKIQGAAMGRFGPKAPELSELFPRGRRGFTQCADDGLESKLQALVTALTAHAAELDAAVVPAAQTLLAEWRAVYQASEASTGAKASAETARRGARSVLERELFLNLLTLAQAFPDAPEKLARYMQQSLLVKKAGKPGAAPTV